MSHLRAPGQQAVRGPARWLTPSLSLLIAAGCTTPGGADDPAGAGSTTSAGSVAAAAVTFDGCAALTAPPSDRSPSSTPSPSVPKAAGEVGSGLPDVTLPCFAGGESLRLAQIRGPAVLNLWGSYCGPCRDELPAVQRLADRTAGRVHVVGVDTNDGRDSAASFGADVGITFPNLFDPAGRMLLAVGRRALPVTVFLDAAGRTYVHTGPALDDAALAVLVREHTGVAVPS